MVREALVQAYKRKMSVVQEGLQDIQHVDHLSEDEDSPAFCLQLMQQDRQRLQLTYTQKRLYVKSSNRPSIRWTINTCRVVIILDTSTL